MPAMAGSAVSSPISSVQSWGVVRREADALVKKPDAVPRGRIERKSRGRPDVPVPVPVDDEVDVDFAGFRPRIADRIGAHPRASRLRRCEVLQVPADLGRAARQREHVLPFAGEEQTAPVVGTAPLKPVESSKCQPDLARAKSYGPHDFGHHECTFGRSVLFSAHSVMATLTSIGARLHFRKT